MERNYGIDLLRIFSMINILILHINKYSNIITFNYYSPKFRPIWLLQIMSYWAVNGFGIISGVVGFRRYKFSNLLFLWFQYCFYSIVFSLIRYLKSNLSIKKYLIISFFPILTKMHWYVNAYFFIYPFFPFINYGIKYLNKNSFRNIILFLFFFCSVSHVIASIFIKKNNYNLLNNGYSSMWLLILYIIGGYIGKYLLINKNKKNNLLYYLIMILIYLFSLFFTYKVFVILKNKNIFINYLSPSILLQSISLILLFSRLKIKPIFIKLISFFSPLTFNVTLIHQKIFTGNFKFIKMFFKFVKGLSPENIFFKIYGLSIIIYIICSFIDYFRFLLFKKLKVKEISIMVENLIPKIIEVILHDN